VAQQGPPSRHSRPPAAGRPDLQDPRDPGDVQDPRDLRDPRDRPAGVGRRRKPEPPDAQSWGAQPPDAPFPAAQPQGTGPSRADRTATADPGSRPGGGSRPGRSDREAWKQNDPFAAADDSDLPPWAGPSIYATRAGGTRLRPPAPEVEEPGDGQPRRRRRGRAAAARLRKSRRRVYIWCGTAILVAVVVAVVAVIHGLPKPAPKSAFISTLQAGEFRAVPSACSAVSPALLSQYLPGTARKVSTGEGSTSSQCSFTVDNKPVFRVLEVALQAYQPSLVAAGNGSATDNAIDSFLVTQQALAHPGKKSPLPAAQVTSLTGLGSAAFSALQVIRADHTVTDLVTVVARDRNVIVTVSLQAQASGKGYGPVAVSLVRSGAMAAGRAVLTKAMAEPAVKR
jgi:hypothetical protein